MNITVPINNNNVPISINSQNPIGTLYISPLHTFTYNVSFNLVVDFIHCEKSNAKFCVSILVT